MLRLATPVMEVGRGSFRTLVAWVFLTVAGTSLVAFQRETPHLLADLPEHSAPFQEGERLRYEINWKPLFLFPAFKAGELAFSIRQSQYLEHATYTISGQVFSDGLLSSVAGLEVRDYFESTIDRKNFRSYRMLRQVRQNERKRDLEVIFDYDGNYIQVREINVEVDPPKEIRNDKFEEIPGPIADVVSVFYVARLRFMKPGDEYLIHLSGGGKVKQVQLQVQEREKVKTEIGVFDAIRISTVGGLFRDGGDFRIWYSTDPLRIPVKFEADAKVGTVYGKIIRLETPRMSRSVIRVP